MTKEKTKITNLYSRGSHGGIDDEYYINELIGLDDFTYDDWIGDKRKGEQQREEIARKYFYKEKKPVHPEWIRARKARHWKILSDHLKMQKEKD